MRTDDMIDNLSGHYTIKVIKAFGYSDKSIKALETTAKSLKEVYRYFEPSFFSGKFYLFKSFSDKVIFDEQSAIHLYDKNILINKTSGNIFLQILDGDKMLMWTDQDENTLTSSDEVLTYYFQNNQEFYLANGETIDITEYNAGSRFASQYEDLKNALTKFGISKIYRSSCAHFSKSWKDPNRLFFIGLGSGNNVPEKYMQLSLYEFLTTYQDFARGINMESSREYNNSGDFTKPKPVDIKITWRESNRSAMIEVKFIGTIKKEDGEIYEHSDPRANKGITQLKGYHDAHLTDLPSTLLKSYLVIIDGRRNNLTKDMTTITNDNGMYYKDIDIVIDGDKEFHKSVLGFEKPIRFFASPTVI